MPKIRCKFCRFEHQRTCTKKNKAKVSINKKRMCKMYEADEGRMAEFLSRRTDLESKLRPDWYWDKDARKVIRTEAMQKEFDQYQTTAVQDTKHPVTGDLSRFGSTVKEED